MSMVHRLLCRIGVHRWMVQSDPETGAPFQECDRCGKERDTVAIVDSNMMG